jgi:hypothetical protein
MAPGGQGAGPGPGMPGVPARPPGWRRRAVPGRHTPTVGQDNRSPAAYIGCLDPELTRALLIRAAEEHVSVSELIRRYLRPGERRKPREPARPAGGNDLDRVPVPSAGAAQWRRPPDAPRRCRTSCVTCVNRPGRFGHGDVLRWRPLITGDSAAASRRARPLPICSAGGSRDPGEVVAAGLVTLVLAARDLRLRNRPAAALT